jgi:hypothetical protein
MHLRELVEEILAVSGKDVARIRDTLRRGSFISGGTRFRWEGRMMEAEELSALLAGFPDSDPHRPFNSHHCLRVVLRAQRQRVEVPREAAAGRRLFRRRSFWDVLVELTAATEPHYVEYSYRDRADRYRLELPREAARHLRDQAGLVKYSTLERQLRDLAIDTVEFLIERR